MINSKQFYTKLTAEGLEKRKNKEHTKKELIDLKKKINKKERILDLGCGYGRFTIPLASEGYNIQGIDITPSFIERAKIDSKNKNLNINFQIGEIRNLPYEKNKFDTIILMWSVFMEIVEEEEQIKAIKEMLRVLDNKGKVIIELPIPYKIGTKIEDKKFGDSIEIKKNNVIVGKLSGIEHMPAFRHDKKSLKKLMVKNKIKKFKIYYQEFGGRKRMFLEFWKN